MDSWELFCHLCKTVVDEQNVFLDIRITSKRHRDDAYANG